MARKRMIDPTIWQDEDFGKLSAPAKVLFIGLFSNADDEGRLRANEAYLKSTIFMYDDSITTGNIGKIVTEVLENMPSVKHYVVDNKHYIQLMNWNEYQKQHKDRIQESTLPPYKEDVTDNVGQVTDNDGVSKDKLSKVSLDKDKLSNNDQNSDEFSDLKKELGIPEKPTKGIYTEYQAEGLRIAQALGASKDRYSAYFKAVKEEPRSLILSAYEFAVDHPTPSARDKMFFFQLNKLKEKHV